MGLGVALFALRRRLWLLGGIYSEAGRSLLSLPALLLLPVSVGSLLALIFFVVLVLLLYITTSGASAASPRLLCFYCILLVLYDSSTTVTYD